MDPNNLTQIEELLQQLKSSSSLKRVEEEFKFVIKFATKFIKRTDQAFYYNGNSLCQSKISQTTDCSTKNSSVIFKTNFAYEVKLKECLKRKGISDSNLYFYLKECFLTDIFLQQESKMSQFFLKLESMKAELQQNPLALSRIEKEITENKKFKLPWTRAEIQKSFQNVLKKFN